MAYSKEIVDFTEEEHVAAKALDEIYEALADGLDLAEDLSAIFGPTVKLYNHLSKAESLAEFGDMFISLGVMLSRDNGFLNKDEDTPVT